MSISVYSTVEKLVDKVESLADTAERAVGSRACDFRAQDLPKIIAVDFDGTLHDGQYPRIGNPRREVIEKLLEEQRQGARLILWTCRADNFLDTAVEWCKKQGISFDAVNDNVSESIKYFGGNSRKVFAHEHIDDRAKRI